MIKIPKNFWDLVMKNKLLGLVLASAFSGASSASYAQTFTLHSTELEGGKFSNANLLSEPYGFGCTGENLFGIIALLRPLAAFLRTVPTIIGKRSRLNSRQWI